MISAGLPHGKFSIDIQDNIICISAQGPWNLEFAEVIHRELLLAATKVDIENYAVYLEPLGEALCGEDVIQSHTDFVARGRTKAVAVNFQHCYTTPISRAVFTKIYTNAGANYEFFENKLAAIAWLQEQLTTSTSEKLEEAQPA